MILTAEQLDTPFWLKMISDDVVFETFTNMFNVGVSIRRIRIGSWNTGHPNDYFETGYTWFLLAALIRAAKENDQIRIAKVRSLLDDN